MTKKQRKTRGGQRTNWKEWVTPERLTLLEGWARSGLTNEQIARNIGVAESTLYNWLRDQPKIKEALKKGKEVIDFEVENALYKSAIGFWADDPDGNPYEYVKPSPGAQIFWLKNRKPHMWREKQEVQHSGQVNSNVNLSNLSEKELRALAEMEIDEDETE